MKALVLSAGFGTRLKPHTLETPKPLFPLRGQPIIDIIIKMLKSAGVTGIAVNTHYMADPIEKFLQQQQYGIDILIRYEPVLLGTGGAVANFSDYLSDGPFIVINSDVITDIDIHLACEVHKRRGGPATLVMHDHPLFNKVIVGTDGKIHGFSDYTGKPGKNSGKLLAFTGISVADPAVLSFIGPETPCCLIDAYRAMIRAGKHPAAHIVSGHYWNDLGTPERFRDAVADRMMPEAFQAASGKPVSGPSAFQKQKLKGDGSDRQWYRITAGGCSCSVIMGDHGITTGGQTAQIDAFASIGKHLRSKGVPVPEIYETDRFSGLVFMEDLGDTLLQDIVSGRKNPAKTHEHYRNVIRILIQMSISGREGFDPDWAYEGARYDRQLIIEKECRYFTARFLQDYAGFSDFSEKGLFRGFACLAESILDNACTGLIHRDFQSRNIMVKDGRHYLIDFQGARFGPIQYDLASLLVDPYVALEPAIRQSLLDFAADTLQAHTSAPVTDRARFVKGYRYCCISRLMQTLGAYSFLSRKRGKTVFEAYINPALARLEDHLHALPHSTGDTRLAELAEVVSSARRLLFRKGRKPHTPSGPLHRI